MFEAISALLCRRSLNARLHAKHRTLHIIITHRTAYLCTMICSKRQPCVWMKQTTNIKEDWKEKCNTYQLGDCKESFIPSGFFFLYLLQDHEEEHSLSMLVSVAYSHTTSCSFSSSLSLSPARTLFLSLCIPLMLACCQARSHWTSAMLIYKKSIRLLFSLTPPLSLSSSLLTRLQCDLSKSSLSLSLSLSASLSFI